MLYQENTFLNIIKNYKKNPYEIQYNITNLSVGGLRGWKGNK